MSSTPGISGLCQSLRNTIADTGQIILSPVMVNDRQHFWIKASQFSDKATQIFENQLDHNNAVTVFTGDILESVICSLVNLESFGNTLKKTLKKTALINLVGTGLIVGGTAGLVHSKSNETNKKLGYGTMLAAGVATVAYSFFRMYSAYKLI